MSAPYIPAKDSLFQAWALNFNTLILANPANYGLAAADATAIGVQYAAWYAAWQLAINPATRTKPSVAAKDATKAASMALFRLYAQQVRRNAGVSNALKANLGLTIADLTPTPIPAPATSPILEVVAATPLQHTIRYADQNTPALRAKPQGVLFLEIHAATSATVISNPDLLPIIKNATKQPVAIDWTSGDVGKTAYYAGRWITRRGLVGPWSNIVSFTVANG